MGRVEIPCLCIGYVSNYFRERYIGHFDPADSILALIIEFRALRLL